LEEDDTKDDNFLSCVRNLSIPQNAKVHVIGDTHGHLADVFTIFRLIGYPSRTNIFIWNGDMTDRYYFSIVFIHQTLLIDFHFRGENGVEICLLVFAFSLLTPGSVFINRGNHECQ
jgi:hypothetical protein